MFDATFEPSEISNDAVCVWNTRHRSLTGCLTCRRRRVKCDDRRPACGVCRRLRLSCEGFEPRILWLKPMTPVTVGDSNGPLHEPPVSAAEAPRESRRLLYTASERKQMNLQMITELSEPNFGRALDGLEAECPADGGTVKRGPLAVFHFQSATSTSASSHVDITDDFDIDDFLRPDVNESSSDDQVAIPFFVSPNHEIELPFPQIPEQEFSVDPCSLDWQALCANALEAGESESRVLDKAHTPISYPLPAPDDFSPIIPSNVKFLLDHFAEEYVDIVSLIENQKSPWRILHLPNVLMTFGELVIWKNPNHFRIALFYATLALSSFHVDRTTGTVEGVGYWWTIGISHYNQAASELRKGLAQEPRQASKVKYKDILMALLTMVTVCITSGRMEDARSHLLRADALVRRRGLPKAQKSRKVKILHSIFVFLRVIEESTFAYPASKQSLGLIAAKSECSRRYPSFDLHHADEIHISQQPAPTDAWVGLAEVEPEGNGCSTFSLVYGIPESLFVLISHVSCLTQQIRLSRANGAFADPLLFQEIERRTKSVEDAICNWKSSLSQEVQGGQKVVATPLILPENALHVLDIGQDLQPSAKVGVGSSLITSKNILVEHMTLAIHSALIIYFYRQIRDVNPLILQPLINQVKEHLLACESYKEQNHIASSSLAWPGFIAAVEAHDENDFQDLTNYLKRCGDRSGLRNFDRAASVATEIRSARFNSPTPCRDSWMDILQARQIPLVCS